jgi:hypothetical protein
MRERDVRASRSYLDPLYDCAILEHLYRLGWRRPPKDPAGDSHSVGFAALAGLREVYRVAPTTLKVERCVRDVRDLDGSHRRVATIILT